MVFVNEWAVGGHGHAGINCDKIGELAGDSGVNGAFRVFKVKNARSVIHAAGEQTCIW